MEKQLLQLQLQPQQVRLKVVTWSIDGLEEHFSEQKWDKEIAQTWSMVTENNYDILCLCLQGGPTNEKVYNSQEYTIIASIRYSLIKDFECLYNVPQEKFGSTSDGIFAAIFVRKVIFPRFSSMRDSVCDTVLKCKQKTHAVSIVTSTFQIIVMSSAFEYNKNAGTQKDYDNKLKIANQAYQKLYQKMKKVNQCIAVWGGDFGFNDQVFHDAAAIGNFTEMEGNIPPSYPMKQLAPCRKNPNDPSCYSDTPNHNDRILISYNDLSNLRMIEYASFGNSKYVQISKHNLVYGSLEFTYERSTAEIPFPSIVTPGRGLSGAQEDYCTCLVTDVSNGIVKHSQAGEYCKDKTGGSTVKNCAPYYNEAAIRSDPNLKKVHKESGKVDLAMYARPKTEYERQQDAIEANKTRGRVDGTGAAVAANVARGGGF